MVGRDVVSPDGVVPDGISLMGPQSTCPWTAGNDRFFVLLCAHLRDEDLRPFYAAASTLWRRRSNPARPYMVRLMTFSRLICPSTGPVLQGSVKAACTAS